MKSFTRLWLFFVLCLASASAVTAQTPAPVDSIVGQITSSNATVLVRDISGDGRFVVFESAGDVATERTAARNNADGNFEIFLFDYAQRRIFQITNTRRVLKDAAVSPVTLTNICVDVLSTRPALSTNGRWIVFNSNATTSAPGAAPNGTNPGNFDGNSFNTTGTTGAGCPNNPLNSDANTEIWLYQIPAVTAVDLSSGVDAPFVDLSAGTFIQATSSLANRLPTPGTTTELPIISDDNRDPAVNADASLVAFTSNREYVAAGNGDGNPEIFVFLRNAAQNQIRQITQTPNGTALNPISNANPSLSDNGQRLAFFSNSTAAPVAGIAGFSNSDGNGEVFYVNLDAAGAATGGRQISATTTAQTSDVVNLYSPGRRISRDGNFIGFDSYSSNPAGSGTVQTGFGLFVYDVAANAFRQIGPRSDADAGALGGDFRRVPVFAVDDTAESSQPTTVVVFASRLNIRQSDGTVPGTASDGQNADEGRPVQIYFAPLGGGSTTPVTRLSNFPRFTGGVADTQPLASNSIRRVAFGLGQTELGGGNADLSSEAFYLLTPIRRTEVSGNQLSYATGASALPVGSPSPTPTPTASPSPTPTTPAVVRGVSPGMLANVNIADGAVPTFTPVAANGVSTARRFNAPIELGGITVSIRNAAAQLLRADNRQIYLVVPAGLPAGNYPVVVNVNGRVLRSTIDIVVARPDVLRRDNVVAAGGRARIFNATNRVIQGEPLTVTSIRIRGGGRVQTRARLFLTGVQGAPASALSIRIGSRTISGAAILTGAVATDQPGVFSIDFLLPPELAGAGDVPVVVTVTAGTDSFTSRLDDTAARVRIL